MKKRWTPLPNSQKFIEIRVAKREPHNGRGEYTLRILMCRWSKINWFVECYGPYFCHTLQHVCSIHPPIIHDCKIDLDQIEYFDHLLWFIIPSAEFRHELNSSNGLKTTKKWLSHRFLSIFCLRVAFVELFLDKTFQLILFRCDFDWNDFHLEKKNC